MANDSKRSIGISSRLVKTVVIISVLLTGYVGAYYASIESRTYTLNANHEFTYYNVYRIDQRMSEVVFWPAERTEDFLQLRPPVRD